MRPVTVALQGVLDPDCTDHLARARFVDRATEDKVAGYELFATPDYLFREHDLFRDRLFEHLKKSTALTLHIYRGDYPDETEYFTRFVAVANDYLDYGLKLKGAVYHPGDVRAIEQLRPLADDIFIAAEVLGHFSEEGRLVEEFDRLFEAHPWLSMTLDSAHVMETEEEGGPKLEVFAERFQDRIRQIHVSWAGNLYPPERMEPDFDTTHSMLNLSGAPDRPLGNTFHWLENSIVTLEGVVPGGQFGQDCLRRELDLISTYI